LHSRPLYGLRKNFTGVVLRFSKLAVRVSLWEYVSFDFRCSQVITLIHTLLSLEETGVRTALVICPLTIIPNWLAEFEKWLDDVDNKDEIKIYDLSQ
jgi:DNA repair photolyase